MLPHWTIIFGLFLAGVIAQTDFSDGESDAELLNIYHKRKIKKVKPLWTSKPEEKAEFRVGSGYDWDLHTSGRYNYAPSGGSPPWNYGKPSEGGNSQSSGYSPTGSENASNQGNYPGYEQGLSPNPANNQMQPSVTQPSPENPQQTFVFQKPKPIKPQQPPNNQLKPGYPQKPTDNESQPEYSQQPPINQGQTGYPQPVYPQRPTQIGYPLPSYPQQPTRPAYPQTEFPQQPTQTGHPQPSYPQRPKPSFPSQPGSQRPQPGYPQQPGSQRPQPTYPQQPQPQPGFPQQPESQRPQPGYPQQPGSQRPQPTYPQQPQPGFPQQPESQRPQPTYPQQPGSQRPQPGYPQQPSYPQQPESQGSRPGFPRPEPSQPQPEFPQQPGYPQQPQRPFPQQPGSQRPQPGYPSQPQQPDIIQKPPDNQIYPGHPFYPQIQPPIKPDELEGIPDGIPAKNDSVSMEELRKYCKAPRGQFGTDRSCNTFINCWDDVVIEQECGGNLLFNEDKKYCDYPDNVDCMGRPITKPFTSPDGNCQSAFGTFRSVTNCGEFFVCVHGVANRFICPGGTAYNDELGVCDYPYRVDCNGVPLIATEEIPDELAYQSRAEYFTDEDNYSVSDTEHHDENKLSDSVIVHAA